jgi:hypothetical protein
MADDKKDEDPPPKSGQVIRGGAPLPLTVGTGEQRTVDWLLSRLSRWPFNNRLYAKSLKAAKEVLEARKELGKTYIEHEEIRDDVRDLPTTIAQRRLKRLREYFEEERRFTAVLNDSRVDLKVMDDKNELQMEEIKRQQKEQQIQRMEQEKRELLLAKELEELRKPPPEPLKKKTARGRSPKQKRREEVLTKYEKEIERIEALKKLTVKAKADLKKAAVEEKEEELQKIEDMP